MEPEALTATWSLLDFYTSGVEGKMGLWWEQDVINPDFHEEKGLLELSGA